MNEQNLSTDKKTKGKANPSRIYNIFVVILLLAVVASVAFLSLYRPMPSAPKPDITLEQKMAYLDAGVPLPGQERRPEVPRWMVMLILGFVVMQVLPLVLAAKKARSKELTALDIRQIEFLTETPLFLGLLGSLLGVFLTQFISGTLSAPLAYLTTISGILIFLFGRFTILLSLPPLTESKSE